MAKIERVEDLKIWQAGIELCDIVYTLTDKDLFSKDFGLKDQIRRCSVSVPSNIAEGFERESNRQFVYFLLISKGSLGELKTQLYIAKNRKYISEVEFKNTHELTVTLGKQLGAFISYLRENIKKTNKNKQSQPS